MPQDNTLYPNGRVAILSTRLLTADKFNRLAEANGLDACVKILYENNYGNGLVLGDPKDFEQLLYKEAELSMQFFIDMTANSKVTDCFILPNDYTNAKLLVKARILGIDVLDKLLVGTIDKDILTQAVNQQKYDLLPSILSDALVEIDSIENGLSPYLIDTILDKAKYKHILFNSKKSNIKEITQYFICEIDTLNIMSAFRCYSAHFDTQKFEFMYIDGGTVACQELVSALNKGVDYLQGLFHYTKYKDFAITCAEELRSGRTLAVAEIMSANMKKNIITPHKNEMESVTPLIAYFLSKKTEIDNIRWILVCKKNKVDETTIKQRLKELYV